MEKKKGNYNRKRNYKDGEIDWRMTSKSIHNLVRALSKPYDGAHFLHNKKTYKLWNTKIKKKIYKNIDYGKIVGFDDGNPIIKCGEGSLVLISIKPKLKLKIGDYI